ncbi:transcription factor TFIIIB subunit [Martiniozyma asiatica (nom. inval.)]|nr:transcription factor TFIIIB subunit [Martiniozyma asiatica]
MSTLTCKNCGSTSFTREFHTASGDLACNSCGAVIEENPIVSEVTFAENAAGGATVQGSYLSNDQAHVNFGNGRGSLESREQTLQNGKRRIKNVALALNIPDFVADSAYQWFQLALTNNFVQGRRSQNVIASCLYVACRREKTHHMLIDFSSRLQVSVYAIGATFLKMVKALHITNLPLVDPSLFIQHYADKLDFGRHKLRVIQDATKLAHRMGDDWIHEGRRPAGVAGACLLLAARMNNFRRTHIEIMAVTHIGSQTIQKRLKEFQDTNAAKLSVNEFREAKNIEESLPPAFKKNRKETDRRKKDIKDIDRIEEEISQDPVLGAMLEDSDITEDEIQHHIKMILRRRENDVKRKVNRKIVQVDGETKVIMDLDEEVAEMEKMIEENRPRNLTTALPSTVEILAKISDEPELLDDVDDPEIELCLLSPEESKQKERLWVGSNQEYLLQQEQKRLKQEADKIAGHSTTIRKKKKDDDEIQKAVKGFTNLGDVMRATLEGGSASDNAKTLLSSKTLSKKINYNAVNNLFDD